MLALTTHEILYPEMISHNQTDMRLRVSKTYIGNTAYQCKTWPFDGCQQGYMYMYAL